MDRGVRFTSNCGEIDARRELMRRAGSGQMQRSKQRERELWRV